MKKLPLRTEGKGHPVIVPLEDYIVVRMMMDEETESKIVVVTTEDSDQYEPLQGTVVSVGKGRRSEHEDYRLPPPVGVGDIALIVLWAGAQVPPARFLRTEEGKTAVYWIIRSRDIMGVMA